MHLKPDCSRVPHLPSAARVAVLLLLLMAGCHRAAPAPETAMPVPPEMPEPPAGPEAAPEPQPLPPGIVPRPAHAVLYDSVATWAEVPDTVDHGDPVPIDLFTVNIAERTITARFRGGPPSQIFEVYVIDAGGELVWRRSHEAPLVTIGYRREMGPGDVEHGREVWDQAYRSTFESPGDRLVPPGRYRIEARGDDWDAAPVEVVIRERR